MVLSIFAFRMIKISFGNTELSELFTCGKSVHYGNLVGHRQVMTQLHGFCSLLSVIDRIEELGCYTYLRYYSDPVKSSVSFVEPDVTCHLLFTEEPDSSITITDFTITDNNEAE